jgi:hypothetical protein
VLLDLLGNLSIGTLTFGVLAHQQVFSFETELAQKGRYASLKVFV